VWWAGRHWLTVILESPKTNRLAIGARVAVVTKGQEPVWRRAHTDSSYLSAQDVRVHFGLGGQPALDGVVVHWPDRSQERFDDIKADRIVTLRQGSGKR
jgi:hypothetical protein